MIATKANLEQREPVAAIATPPGTAGIAVIRISGRESVRIADTVFQGRKPLAGAETHSAHFGEVVDENGNAIDQVVATLFRAPQSYTGEDVVEISCHGGSVVSRAVLQRCFGAGARPAEPGEFTRRAFLNGKMDLSQAEAVADLIHAQSEDARKASLVQLEGRLARYVTELRDGLIHAASLLELSLDFAEEDVELLDREQLRGELEAVQRKIADALATYSSGKIVRDGVSVVIAGKPNAGKSSLLNALLNTQRAIVTDVPGTTRDYIEEPAILDGELFRFADTAGIRETQDTIELLGIQYSRDLLRDADIACCIVDGTRQEIDEKTLQRLQEEFQAAGIEASNSIFVVNKIDLLNDIHADRLQQANVCWISALTGAGLDSLKQRLVSIASQLKSGHRSGEVMITNVRHADCLERSSGFVQGALDALDASKSEEFLALEIRSAIEALGEIIGEVVTDDILNAIFSRFCIGK